ncbi:MAG TPA: 30S ribosomal protein S6 [Treponema sp.]|nr:30S ribosomal protein S6 [Treponema sp.]
MRKYELMVVFPVEEDRFKSSAEAVRKVLADYGVQIEGEEPYGDRDLSYEIKKQKKGRYLLFNIKAAPEKIVEIDRQFKLIGDLLNFLFVRVEE